MADDDLPRDEYGFYAMWIIRYAREGRVEEIHIPRYDAGTEHGEVRRRARALATEHGTIVLYAAGTTSALVNTGQHHPVYGRPLWMAVLPRDVPYEVVECPNLEQHRRPDTVSEGMMVYRPGHG